MASAIGRIEALFRYPVKSMAGERLETAQLGWHGLDGDRRLAWRRLEDASGFPWLSASRLPELLLFTPLTRADNGAGAPTHVRTPDGRELEIGGEELSAEIARRHGAPVQLMRLDHGMFDESSISVITVDTILEIGRAAGRDLDVRRFRPNIVVRSLRPRPFEEDDWLGAVLRFGEGNRGPAVSITLRDVRCSMVNLDPDSARSDPGVMKAVVRTNQNNAGAYGTVVRSGTLAVGDAVRLEPERP